MGVGRKVGRRQARKNAERIWALYGLQDLNEGITLNLPGKEEVSDESKKTLRKAITEGGKKDTVKRGLLEERVQRGTAVLRRTGR